MIPVDTSCEPGPREVQREYNRDRGVNTAAGRDTFFPSPSKATMLASPRRSTRLAGNSGGGGGFKGVKRHRRYLKLPTGRMLRAQLRLAERSGTLPGDEMSLPVVGTARSDLLRSAVFTTESDDAVVPRCGGSGGSRHQDEMTSGAPSSASSVISSAPVLAAAPKDAKQPCFHHHQQHQHHHLPQQEHHHSHPHHHQHQQQDQQQHHHHHLSSGCQMSSSSSSLSSSSSAETLIGRVPMASPRLINIPIHDDPRQWSRLDVRTWLDHVRRVYNIRDLDLDRFPMNGKALCIMSKDMFVYRVPHGGVPLYIDFQLRFRRALSIR